MSGIIYQSTTDRVKVWLDADDTTLHIQFNNPERHNALSVDMWEAVTPLLDKAEADDNIRLVVFSGAGEKAFVSGADITQFEDMPKRRLHVTKRWPSKLSWVFTTLVNPPWPVFVDIALAVVSMLP
jgi:enoyl-CoA hydratase